MQYVTMRCPSCGSENVGSDERLQGTAVGEWRRFKDDEDVFFEPAGETVIHWDSQETVEDDPCICRDCSWSGEPYQLDGPQEYEEEEGQEEVEEVSVVSAVENLDQTVERKL